MNRLVSPQCLKCPTFRAGKCAGKIGKRLVATDAPIARKDKQEGDISSVFSRFSGRKSAPLPDRFRDVKRNLTVGLKVRTEEVATKREAIIPQLNFSDIQAGNVSPAKIEAIRRTGVAVIRGVVPKGVTEDLLADVRQYFDGHSFTGFPSDAEKKVIYESYWSPSQVKARSHSNMLVAQSWMNQLYRADADQKIDLSVPLTYCDRVQIRPPGDRHFGLPPHVDGGGVERWEDPSYNHVYRKIFQGNWREYNPWDLTGRLDANMNIAGLDCLAMGPNKVHLSFIPSCSPPLPTGFFGPSSSPLAKVLWMDGSSPSMMKKARFICMVLTPELPTEHTPDHHPHLNLAETMIPNPTVEPGDTVFWSADTIHGTEAVNAGKNDACLFYIPSVPLTPNNAQYVAQQRDAFLKGVPPPDFPGGLGESQFSNRAQVGDIQSDAGRVAMGLDPIKPNGKNDRLVQEINKILGH
ncbi:hypothetical protein N7465_001204 [Penicillium sp. CMV-2018d]|nr:hypothetical protein N7465_001204 [Penicillium sp. CMV-2018d]